VFHEFGLLKENAENDTRLQNDSIIIKQSGTSKVKVELFGDKDSEKEAVDYEERTTAEVEEHKSSELP